MIVFLTDLILKQTNRREARMAVLTFFAVFALEVGVGAIAGIAIHVDDLANAVVLARIVSTSVRLARVHKRVTRDDV